MSQDPKRNIKAAFIKLHELAAIYGKSYYRMDYDNDLIEITAYDAEKKREVVYPYRVDFGDFFQAICNKVRREECSSLR